MGCLNSKTSYGKGGGKRLRISKETFLVITHTHSHIPSVKLRSSIFEKFLKMNPFIDLFPGFSKRIYKNSFTTIFEGFCKNWKYLSLRYQNLGAAISMEHLCDCFCICGGRPSPNHIWLASWVCFYNSLL